MTRDQWLRSIAAFLTLTLIPASSTLGEWCEGGSYEGALYAVPHPPPCTKRFPCYGRGSCGPLGGVCGVVPKPVERYEYSYPGGVPRPIDRRSRIVGRFTVKFGSPAPAGPQVET